MMEPGFPRAEKAPSPLLEGRMAISIDDVVANERVKPVDTNYGDPRGHVVLHYM